MENTKLNSEPELQPSKNKAPDEAGTVKVADFIKIFDPNTQEKFVEHKND